MREEQITMFDGCEPVKIADKRLNVLIACEESQTICNCMREYGHNAFSADIQECSGGHPEWHILGDVLPYINGNCSFVTMDGVTHSIEGRWDLIVAHPPCTYLSGVQNLYYNRELFPEEYVSERERNRQEAVQFFMKLVGADCERIAVENPVGYMNTHYRKPDFIIHPFYFAESADDEENYKKKRTCFWVKGLPNLAWTIPILPPPRELYSYVRTRGKYAGMVKHVNWCDGVLLEGKTKEERSRIRSKTFPGIAKAITLQWAGDARHLKG